MYSSLFFPTATSGLKPSFLICLEDLLAVELLPVEVDLKSSFQFPSNSSSMENWVTKLAKSNDPGKSNLEGKACQGSG